MKQNITENIYGVKYTITPRIDLTYIFTLIAQKVVQFESPALLPSPDLTFEYIMEYLKIMNQVALLGIIYAIIILVLCCIAIPLIIIIK